MALYYGQFMSSKSIKERKNGLYHKYQTWEAIAGLILVIRRLKIWDEPLSELVIEECITNLSEMSYRYQDENMYKTPEI